MVKLTNILKEIKIRNNNIPYHIFSNEELCRFLNNNIKELIKKDKITDNEDDEHYSWLVDNIGSLGLEVFYDVDFNVVMYNEEIGVAYHWLCPKENLPDWGSFRWDEEELYGVKFWEVNYNI